MENSHGQMEGCPSTPMPGTLLIEAAVYSHTLFINEKVAPSSWSMWIWVEKMLNFPEASLWYHSCTAWYSGKKLMVKDIAILN